MKHRFLLILIMASNQASGVEIKHSITVFRTETQKLYAGVDQVQSNRPNLDRSKAFAVAVSANRAARKFKIPLNIVLAIAYVESGYDVSAVNSSSNDYGIMQVNAWHLKRSKLDKQKLLTDMDYSFYHGVRIFKWFYDRYPLEEAIRRYNCGTSKNCINYRRVKNYLTKVRKAL